MSYKIEKTEPNINEKNNFSNNTDVFVVNCDKGFDFNHLEPDKQSSRNKNDNNNTINKDTGVLLLSDVLDVSTDDDILKYLKDDTNNHDSINSIVELAKYETEVKKTVTDYDFNLTTNANNININIDEY